MKGKGVKAHCLPIYWFYPGSLLDFKKILFTLYTYVLTKILDTKWYKVYTKTDPRFQKSHKEFGQLQTTKGNSKKLKFDGLILSKKYIPSAKTLCT